MPIRATKIFFLIVSVLMSAANLFAKDHEFMMLYKCRVMVDDSLCYLIKKGSPFRRNLNNWEPYCGYLENFYFAEGYGKSNVMYQLMVVNEYDPHADTIQVVHVVCRDESHIYSICDCDQFRKQYAKNNDLEKCNCHVVEEMVYSSAFGIRRSHSTAKKDEQ